jgi:hypothetical protein
MKKIFLTLLLSLVISQAFGQDTYLCIPNKRTGFAYNASTKSWEQTGFRTGDTKKILRRTNGQWKWHLFGEKDSPYDCGGVDFGRPDDFNIAGFIFCRVSGGHMRMNKNSLRYVETHELGFIDGKDDKSLTPLIEIGTCSPL